MLPPEDITDPIDRLRSVIATVLPLPVVVNIFARECAIFYYALFPWRSRPHVPPDGHPFTFYKRSGKADVFGLLPIACAFEMLPAHLFLAHWTRWLAWPATGLSLYAAIWMLAQARAFALRPAFVTPHMIRLRFGLLFDLRVPVDLLSDIRAATQADQELAVPRRTPASMCMQFHIPLPAERLFGIRTLVQRIAFTPDYVHEFERAMASLRSS